MKKNMFPIFACLLAVGFAFATSAFKAEDSKQASYYWYRVNAAGQIPAGSAQFGGAKQTITHADTNDGCDGTSALDCLRGFSNQVTSFPSSAMGDVRTKKTN